MLVSLLLDGLQLLDYLFLSMVEFTKSPILIWKNLPKDGANK